MLIKLTKASGGIKLVNTRSFMDVDTPQARDDGQYKDSRSIVTYDRPHPTKPNMNAFDFFKETPEEIFNMARGEIGGSRSAPMQQQDGDPGFQG